MPDDPTKVDPATLDTSFVPETALHNLQNILKREKELEAQLSKIAHAFQNTMWTQAPDPNRDSRKLSVALFALGSSSELSFHGFAQGWHHQDLPIKVTPWPDPPFFTIVGIDGSTGWSMTWEPYKHPTPTADELVLSRPQTNPLSPAFKMPVKITAVVPGLTTESTVVMRGRGVVPTVNSQLEPAEFLIRFNLELIKGF